MLPHFKKLCHGYLDVLRSKLPQIKTKYLCHTRNAYKAFTGRYQVNFRRENRSPRHKAINLKNLTSSNSFPSWPSAAQDTYFYF